MEDYLEMICRLLSENEVVRINELSEKLNVKPSSASKMVRTLRDSGYLKFHSYGYIGITEKGQIEDITGGSSLDANIQLVYNNAKLATATACELAKLAK